MGISLLPLRTWLTHRTSALWSMPMLVPALLMAVSTLFPATTQAAGRAGRACGNGVVEEARGEQCDAGFTEICNNSADDDGDGATDCADDDCAGVPTPGCNARCQLVPVCAPILDGQAAIAFSETPQAVAPGLLKLRGRIPTTTPLSPLEEAFLVVLSNADGDVYRAEVAAGTLRRSARGRGRFLLDDSRAATASGGDTIRSLRVRRYKDGNRSGYAFRLEAVGDFSLAALAQMTMQIYFGDDVAYRTATWTGRPGRWVLSPSNPR